MTASSTLTTSVLAAVERFGDSVAWYDEWPALKPILETMNMAECQRCCELCIELTKQELEHSSDEIDWRESLTDRNRMLSAYLDKITELERQLIESQRQNQQLQQQLDAMRAQKQAAERAQCNSDYMGSIGGRG